MKICKKCNLELNEESFPIKEILPNGKRCYRSVCKVCVHTEKLPFIVTLPDNMKVCSDCNNLKQNEDLVKNRNICKSCYNEKRKIEPKEKDNFKVCSCCKEEKFVEDFRNRRNGKGTVYKHSLCKVCENKRRSVRSRIKRETVVKDERYYINLERKKKITSLSSKSARLRKYGITEEDLEKMELDQKNKCYLCDKDEIYNPHGKLCIDHSHNTGKVRKLLCNACNALLGAAKDSSEFLRKCADYIEDFS